MARVTLVPAGSAVPFLYNVDLAVGPGSANQRDDVLLVQYLIKTVLDNASRFSPPFAPLPLAPGEVFKVDGFAGPITFRAIKHFQDASLARGNPISTDGRVDKAKGNGATKAGSPFTIFFLNSAYRRFRENDFNNIALASDCPAELKPVVSIII